MTHKGLPSELILASSSVYRRRLLERLGLTFTTATPSIDETTRPGESAQSLSKRLSREKAQVISTKSADPLVIGADQVAACENRLLGKPGSAAGAIEQLSFCAGRYVVFFSSIALWRPAQNQLIEATETVEVSMRALELAEIEAYVAKDKPLDCAGSFKVESLGIALFRSVTARDPTALEGLPLITVSAMLRDVGYAIP
ncbi:MAG: Maf family protein [Proteobacteria bacterium]|jgi:septum formation protein|nr:Maf family protein [Pseudomonadota bacterium]